MLLSSSPEPMQVRQGAEKRCVPCGEDYSTENLIKIFHYEATACPVIKDLSIVLNTDKLCDIDGITNEEERKSEISKWWNQIIDSSSKTICNSNIHSGCID